MIIDAKVTLVKGMQFVGTANSGHAIVMDADKSVGGDNTGSRPMELVAMAYGGCTGMDVISILRKKKQDVHDLEMIIRAEKAEKHPKRYTDIHIEFVVRGRGIDEAAVKRAIELSSDKYCAVGATLKPNANITNSYRIEEI